MATSTQAAARPKSSRGRLFSRIIKHWQLYLLLLLPVVYLIIFKYVPIYGLQIAFRDYSPALGTMGSPWVGLKHFSNFFSSYQFGRLLSNTLILGIYSLIASVPFPILLALSINSVRCKALGKTAQMVTYAPYFISTVILVSMITQILAVRGGLLNNILAIFGMEPVNLMASPTAFRHIYVISNIWQGTGYNAVIYIAALSGINPELYEAARIDGASIFQRLRYIDLPSIASVAIMLLILNCGSIINVSYEKVLLLQNDMNMETADVISTYVYRMGITSAQYSYSAAIGLFNSVVSVVLLVIVNAAAKKFSDTSLF